MQTGIGAAAVRAGGIEAAIAGLSRRQWYTAAVEIVRDELCCCGHPVYAHHILLLASNTTESCDNSVIDAALRSTCRCNRMELPEAVSRRVAEWVVAQRVGEALVG